MTERMPRSTAPDPLEMRAAAETSAPITTERGWEEYNADVGRLVDDYLGKTYTLDGKQYTVWFARPAGGINEGRRYISEFDLAGENGDFIEGISAEDLATRIDESAAENIYTQESPQDNGDQDQDQPSQDVLKRRENYLLNDAKWRLGDEVIINGHVCVVEGVVVARM